MPVLVDAIRSEPTATGQRVSAGITVDGLRSEVWFQCPGPACAAPADAFLAISILPAMRTGQPLHVDGSVSERLLRSCGRIQEIFRCWHPELSMVDVSVASVRTARAGPAPPQDARSVGASFTGGVDGFYTALKRHDELGMLLFGHGLDVPLDNHDLRARVSSSLQQAAKRLGTPLVEVETNLRSLSDPFMSWYLSFGPALCAIGMLLSSSLRRMYIGAGQSYRALYADGAHPMLVPLFSTEEIEFEVDGCERNRVEKIEVIAANEIVRDSLRVCLKNYDGAYNCCRCEKCLRTMASLEMFGALAGARTFPEPLSYASLIRARPVDPVLVFYARENLEAAIRIKSNPRLIAALRESVAPSLPRRVVRKLPRGRLRYWYERTLNAMAGF